MSVSPASATNGQRRSQRRLAQVATTAAALTGFLPPLFGTYSRYSDFSEHLQQSANVQAVIVGRYAAQSPDNWMFRAEHVAVMLQGIRHAHERTVVESDGKVVVDIDNGMSGLTMTRRAEFAIHGQPAGAVRVTENAAGLVRDALMALLFGTLATAFLLWLLRRFVIAPMRAANRARRRIEERMADLVDLSSDWFWEQDENFRFTMNSLGSFSDMDSGDFIGKTRWELPITLSADQWAAHRADLEAHRHFTLRYPIGEGDTLRWFEIRGKPVVDRDGRFTGYRGVGRDITWEIQREQELLRHRDHLQEMVDEQLAEVVRAKQAAETANAAKSEFLANVSHELRTPMHGVLSFAKLGLGKADIDSAKAHQYFGHINESGTRLLRLLNDLLDLSKMEAGKTELVLAPGDLATVARNVIEALAPLATERRLQIMLNSRVGNSRLEMDAGRVAQVLHNLLANALRFGPAGTAIEVGIDAATVLSGKRRDDCTMVSALRLTVADSGPGLPEDELESVFDKFVQSSKTKTGAGGTGLGLAICREIVALHGGTISARNREGGGAVFELLLPRGRNAAAEPTKESP